MKASARCWNGLLSEVPGRRFEQAGEVLQALKAVPMPESTGPMPSSERTVVLAPVVLASAELPAALPQAVGSPSSSASPASARR